MRFYPFIGIYWDRMGLKRSATWHGVVSKCCICVPHKKNVLFVYFISNKAVKRVQISAMAKPGFQWINRLPWGKGSPMFPQLANGCNPSWDIMGIYPMSTWDFKEPWPPNEKQIQLYSAVAPRHNPCFQRRFMPFDQQTALAPIAVSPLFGQSYLPLSWKDKSSLEPMRNWSCWRKCVQ